MQNQSDLADICERLVLAQKNGASMTDVIEQTSYSVVDLLFELALAYLDVPSEWQEDAEFLRSHRSNRGN